VIGGMAREGLVNIQWVTIWEEYNDFFTMGKSADGKTWDEFRFVDGKGESCNPTTYRIFDDQPFPML